MRYIFKLRDKEYFISVFKINYYNEIKVSNLLIFLLYYDNSIFCECVGDIL